MSHDNVTRRRLLQGVGAGVALGGMIGTAGAQEAEDYIVGVRNQRGVEQARGRAESVKRVLDFDDIGKAVAGRFSQEALGNLRNNPNVRYVEEDGTMHAIEIDSGDSEVPWGVDRVDAEKVHNDETGSGAEIAIIDTGVDYTHVDLNDNYVADLENDDIGGYDFVNEDEDPMDDNGHGTHCAGTAAAEDNGEGVVGVAPAPDLYGVKVLDSDGSGSYSDVAAGIEYTADQGWEVGSLSLGGSSDSQTVKDACTYAYDGGVLLVAAAGNDGPRPNSVKYPAKYDTVIAVSATTRDDSLPRYSSRGPEVELAAPGNDIESTLLDGGYGSKSGTSMACPHVSGAGGLLMANGYTNTGARQRLRDTAEDIGLDDDEQGYGLLDAEAAVSDDANTAPSCTIVNPNDGDTVSGTVTVQVDASDEEDDDTNLDVEVSIDGGTYQSAGYNSDSGYYEYDWDTTGVDDGDHTIDARATDSDGATTEADQITVTVDNNDGTGDTAPAIDKFALSDDSNPAWTRYYVDWEVSDDDGDLNSVTSEMVDSDGNVLDSESSSVGGSSASGTHYLETKSNASEIVLTVTDEAGNETSDSESI